MEDMLDVLAADHEEIRQVLSELEKGPTAGTGATDDQLMLRKMMTDELIIEEFKHEEIELDHLWPTVRQYVPGGDGLADLGICAELEIFAILPALAKRNAGQRDFETQLGEFTRLARAHFDFEEQYVWPRLRTALPPRVAAELGSKVLAGKQAAAVPALPGAWTSPGENARYGSFG